MSAGDGDVDLDREWWKEAVVYQIYPRSFNDTDGDGVGDIPGIIERVDYLDSLGVDLVWLCPVYDSPNADNGYDIRDYRSIMDEFGTMDDWERLRDALHDRDIRLIMDLVVNHTSDEHEWFQQSRRNPDGEYGDYYVWRDGRPAAEVAYDSDEGPEGEAPPNNWRSFMGGSAWSYDEERGQWYLHLFDEKQPDLNWETPAVREDVKSMMTWWLEKGIDGFRMDAINYLSKPEGLPDGDPDQSPVGLDQFSHGPRIHEYLRGLYDDVLSNYDVVTVAEMSGTSVEQAANYLGEDGDGLNMIFHFEHMDVDIGPGGRWDHEEWGEWDLRELKEILSRWQTGLAGRGWNSLYLGNHDQPRIVSRFGDDAAYRRESAKLLATFLMTLSGTPFVYQGEEIGMTNLDFGSLDALDDPMTVGVVEDLIEAGTIDGYDDVREFVNYMSRDHSRTPMQWSDGPNAGFTDGEPWFAVNPNYPEINVESARSDDDSILAHYRELVELRHAEDVLVYGEYDLLCPDHDQIFAYTRTLDEDAVLVVLNWSPDPATFDASSVDVSDASVMSSNYADAPTPPGGETLRPYEAVVYRL